MVSATITILGLTLVLGVVGGAVLRAAKPRRYPRIQRQAAQLLMERRP